MRSSLLKKRAPIVASLVILSLSSGLVGSLPTPMVIQPPVADVRIVNLDNVETFFDYDALGDYRIVEYGVRDVDDPEQFVQELTEAEIVIGDMQVVPPIAWPDLGLTVEASTAGGCGSQVFCHVGILVTDPIEMRHCRSKHQVGYVHFEVDLFRYNTDAYAMPSGINGDLYAVAFAVVAHGRTHAFNYYDDTFYKFKVWMDVDHADDAHKYQRLINWAPRGTGEDGVSYSLGVTRNGPSAGISVQSSGGSFTDYSRAEKETVNWESVWNVPYFLAPDRETITMNGAVTMEVPLATEGRLTLHTEITFHRGGCMGIWDAQVFSKHHAWLSFWWNAQDPA